MIKCKLPGPELPAQTVSFPVKEASAPAAKAAVSSCLTCSKAILPLRRKLSFTEFKLSPVIPYMRSIPALAKTSISTSEIRFFAILSPIFNK